jgi:hypothetical protein
MVSTRCGDYSTPEKNPPPPSNFLLHRAGPATRRTRPRRTRPCQLSAAVDYATSLTFDDEQLYYENDVAAEGNNDAGSDDRGTNDDDGGDDHGMNDDEGEQQVEEEMGEAWERVTKICKSQMSDDELRTYFDSQLRGVGECPNLSCNCVAIIADRDVRDSVVRYLCWFNAKTKYEQDSIVFEWFKYSSYLKKGSKITWFCLPFIDDCMSVVPEAVRMHVLCSQRLLLVLNWGSCRWRSIRKASTVTGVMLMHKAKGKTNYNSLSNNDRKMGPLMRHLEYLMELGDKVRATRVITTLVKGMQARVNHDDDDVRASLLPQC